MPNDSLQFGYKLSSEEHPAPELVRFAQMAEEHGFSFALISDHFHPWTDRQGQSPFVWSVLGGIAQSTKTLKVGTGVTCPTTRTHPAIIAQAAATIATMMPERFFLGVGSGENLNEHIVGERWPEVDIRQQMLAEAVEVIRTLWDGGLQSHHGEYYTVENARLYSLPQKRPELLIAAAGPKSARLAAEKGDGLVGTQPDSETIREFESSGGRGKPRYCEIHVCFDRDQKKAEDTAQEIWAVAGLPGPVHQELPLPSHFEKASKLVSRERLTQDVPCGPDPEKYVRAIRQYLDAGYDHVCIHQIGPAQEAFMNFCAREVLPKLRQKNPAL